MDRNGFKITAEGGKKFYSRFGKTTMGAKIVGHHYVPFMKVKPQEVRASQSHYE